jgi:hypothetical protein
MHPRADMDDVDKRKFLTLQGLELRPLGRPARSQSLYRLRYSGSRNSLVLRAMVYSCSYGANYTSEVIMKLMLCMWLDSVSVVTETMLSCICYED